MIVSLAMLSQQVCGKWHFAHQFCSLTLNNLQESTQVKNFSPLQSPRIDHFASTLSNLVLYYSNDILAKSLPRYGPYISFGIAVINVIMTFAPVMLVEVL